MPYATTLPIIEIDIWRSHGPGKPAKGNHAVCLSTLRGGSIIREFRTRKAAMKFRAKCMRICRGLDIRVFCKEPEKTPIPLLDKLCQIVADDGE